MAVVVTAVAVVVLAVAAAAAANVPCMISVTYLTQTLSPPLIYDHSPLVPTRHPSAARTKVADLERSGGSASDELTALRKRNAVLEAQVKQVRPVPTSHHITHHTTRHHLSCQTIYDYYAC